MVRLSFLVSVVWKLMWWCSIDFGMRNFGRSLSLAYSSTNLLDESAEDHSTAVGNDQYDRCVTRVEISQRGLYAVNFRSFFLRCR